MDEMAEVGDNNTTETTEVQSCASYLCCHIFATFNACGISAVDAD
jgi:hypothetical protein